MIVSLPLWISSHLCIIADHLREIAPWRLIGGVVRDILQNREAVDIDIGIAAHPDSVIDGLRSGNFTVIPTGYRYGTITVISDSGARFEITSLRRDVYCDGRRAKVDFTDDWALDAARRDFTINSMSMDYRGKLYDYFDGYKHLIQNKLIFVGDPEARIKEDYLRVLRYWRFLATMNLPNIDVDSYNASASLFSGLKNISGERIQSEMFKLLSGDFAADIVNKMIKLDLLGHIGISYPNKLLKTCNDPIINLAMLIRSKDDEKTRINMESLVLRWKLSNRDKRILNDLVFPKVNVNWGGNLSDHKKYVYLLGNDVYRKLKLISQLQGVELSENAIYVENLVRPIMPIVSRDITFLSGKDLGMALRLAEEYWIKKDFLPSKDDLLLYIKGIYS